MGRTAQGQAQIQAPAAQRMAAAIAPSTLPTPPLHPSSLHESLVATLLGVTAGSQHSYEIAVHRLLLDLVEQQLGGELDAHSYGAVIGTAIDVLFFFNYDYDLLTREENVWYRASIIHQIGQGMLQTIARLRPELSARAFFVEAASALAPHYQPRPANDAKPSPLSCLDWESAREMRRMVGGAVAE